MTEFAAGFLLLAAALFAALWQRTRSGLRRAAAAREAAEQNGFCLAAVLAAAPIAGFRWSREGTATALGAAAVLGGKTSYNRLLTELDPADAMEVAGAVEQLRQAGKVFDAAVSSRNGGAYAVEGRTTASGEAV